MKSGACMTIYKSPIYETFFNQDYHNFLNNSSITILEHGYLCAAEDWRFRDTGLIDNKLYFVTKGKGYVETPEKTYELTPGSIYLVPAHTRFRYWCEPGFEKFYLHFIFSILYANGIFEGIDRILVVNDKNHVSKTLTNIYKAGDRLRFLHTKPIIEQLIISFLEQISERAEEYFQMVFLYQEIYQYIENHLRFTLSTEEIAQETGFPLSRLRTNFRQDMGCSVKQYARKILFQRICNELKYSHQPIKAIAQKYGFEDVYYFSNWFKRCAGRSPSAFRKNLLEIES